MFNLDNIKLDEFDMYTLNTEIILNGQMISNGFNVGTKMVVGNDVFLKYYRIENNNNGNVIEKNIVMQYRSDDMYIYILKDITKEQITREVENIKFGENNKNLLKESVDK